MSSGATLPELATRLMASAIVENSAEDTEKSNCVAEALAAIAMLLPFSALPSSPTD